MENLAYIKLFLQTIHLPQEAQTELNAAAERVNANPAFRIDFVQMYRDMQEGEIGFGEALESLNEKAEACAISAYTLHFLFLVSCTQPLREQYRAQGISEQIFWDTMDDFRCKLMECRECKGVWGTFVASWYGGFLECTRFALGRFQYERSEFSRERYEKAGLVLQKGDAVINFHIPSSGQPFDEQARLASYRSAYEFFGCRESGEPLKLVCSSWLLYKGHEEFLPERSNILSFMRDFDIIDSWDNDNFGDAWRVFGRYAEQPIEQLPEDTSLRRAFKQRLLEGKKTGGGYGVILFDGEKILNIISARNSS